MRVNLLSGDDRIAVEMSKQEREVIRAALTELNIRLAKGMANSDLQDDTVRIWYGAMVHESRVPDILKALG